MENIVVTGWCVHVSDQRCTDLRLDVCETDTHRKRTVVVRPLRGLCTILAPGRK